MARRRKSDSEVGVSMDSLMDALTNVVAVLILVLILVQADVTQKVQQFLDDLKPATPEQVEQARVELAKLEERRERREKMLKEDAPKPAVLEAERRQVALLEKGLKENKELLADLKEVQALEKKLRKERDAEAAETEKLQQEIAKLEAMLDATPEKVAKPDIVSIPSSRPIPDGAKVYYALTFGGRIHLIDPFTPLDRFEQEFRRHKNDMLAQRIKRQGADRYLYSAAKMNAHFKDFDFGNRRGQKVEILTRPYWGRARIKITPDPKKGTTTEQLETPQTAPFAQAIKALARQPGAVMMFWVHPDSFSTYLKARQLADAVNLPAGWVVRYDRSYTLMIPDVEMKPTAKPPPPSNKPPSRPKPPTLAPTLD